MPRERAVTFDLFGTLVDRPERALSADVVAAALETEGVDVPAGFEAAYGAPTGETDPNREVPLTTHVARTLAASGAATVAPTRIEAALHTLCQPPPAPRSAADAAIRRAASIGPVGVVSDCSIPGLVEQTLQASELPVGDIDVIVTSVDVGWRKPHPVPFATAAEALGVHPTAMIHVGDDPVADRGIETLGGRFVFVDDDGLSPVFRQLEADPWS